MQAALYMRIVIMRRDSRRKIQRTVIREIGNACVIVSKDGTLFAKINNTRGPRYEKPFLNNYIL